MKNLRMNYSYILILVLGLFLRSFNFYSYPFGFDQVQILENSSKILTGDVTLIGPRTGPANLFTGPLIYYVNALSQLVINSPYSLVLTSITLSFLTGLGLMFLTKRYTPEISKSLLLLWAVSPFLINLDRIPWNPNLTLLASSLAFFPLLHKGRLNLMDNLLIALGIFLGFQAHFGGLLLAPTVVMILIIQRRFSIASVLTVVTAQLLTLLPTLLFDLRNNWLNLRGVLELVSGGSEGVSLSLITRFINLAILHIQSLGFILFDTNHSSLILVSGLVIFLAFWFSFAKKTVSILWLGCLFTLLLGYGKSMPPYYLLIQYPVLLYIFATVLTTLVQLLPNVSVKNSKKFISAWILCIFFLCLYGVINTISRYNSPQDLSIHSTITAKQEIIKLAQDQPVSELIYDIEHVDSIGLRYLLSDVPLDRSNGNPYHLVYPHTSRSIHTVKFAPNSAIWIDSRTDTSRKYLTKPQFILSYPSTWQLLETQEEKPFNSQHVFVVLNNSNQIIAKIFVLPRQEDLPFIRLSNNEIPSSWNEVNINDKTWFYQFFGFNYFLIEPIDSSLTIQNFKLIQ